MRSAHAAGAVRRWGRSGCRWLASACQDQGGVDAGRALVASLGQLLQPARQAARSRQRPRRPRCGKLPLSSAACLLAIAHGCAHSGREDVRVVAHGLARCCAPGGWPGGCRPLRAPVPPRQSPAARRPAHAARGTPEEIIHAKARQKRDCSSPSASTPGSGRLPSAMASAMRRATTSSATAGLSGAHHVHDRPGEERGRWSPWQSRAIRRSRSGYVPGA